MAREVGGEYCGGILCAYHGVHEQEELLKIKAEQLALV